ncbi:MAG: hypothetical protein ACE5HY_01040 [Candidatus Hydrothermarchaeales archaeon]
MPESRCIVCGEFVLAGEICKDCEKKTLKEVRSKARILSTITTISLLLILYGAWSVYGPVIMDMDTAAIKSYPLVFEIPFEILRSPKLFPLILMGLLLIVFALLFVIFHKKVFLDSSKKYLT